MYLERRILSIQYSLTPSLFIGAEFAGITQEFSWKDTAGKGCCIWYIIVLRVHSGLFSPCTQPATGSSVATDEGNLQQPILDFGQADLQTLSEKQCIGT